MNLPSVGDRIRLTSRMIDPDPIPVGSTGTVTHVNPTHFYAQVSVDWDNGRKLMMIVPPDTYEAV